MESKHVEEFLVWLLGTNDLDFKTMSSDMAGIAVCLCDLGIDILHVLGTGFSDEPHVGACSVIYSEEPFFYDSKSVVQRAMRLLSRAQSITIPLEHPWECITSFQLAWESKMNAGVLGKRVRRRQKRSGSESRRWPLRLNLKTHVGT